MLKTMMPKKPKLCNVQGKKFENTPAPLQKQNQISMLSFLKLRLFTVETSRPTACPDVEK